MSKLNRAQIKAKARSVLAQSPKGIRWVELLRAVEKDEPETPHNSIHGGVHHLLKEATDIVKIAKGTYILASFVDGLEASAGAELEQATSNVQTAPPTHLESLYYEGFAEWLKEELEEVNQAVEIGGNVLKGKWGTPDVIGVLRPKSSDLVKYETQIISAEIKTDAGAPVVAFGQAVAYRLFSHKSYMVMPTTISKADLSRLDALATIYGIGLVTFTLNPESPDFTLRVRALPSQPDMFYVNEMARRLFEHNSKLFNSLFG